MITYIIGKVDMSTMPIIICFKYDEPTFVTAICLVLQKVCNFQIMESRQVLKYERKMSNVRVSIDI